MFCKDRTNLASPGIFCYNFFVANLWQFLKTEYSAKALRRLAEVEQIHMYYVYAIYNSKNDDIYIGQCENLEIRIDLHNKKHFVKSYTARFDGKWELIYSEEVENRSEALKREKQLKSIRGREFIKSFIK